MTSLFDAPPAALVGDQRPRILSAPPAAGSSGAEAVELARSAGLVLDPWQTFVLEQALGERPDGRWAAFEVGLVLGRQNGKGAVLEALELAALFLFGERLILHSAHEFKTAEEAFRRIRDLIDGSDQLRRRVAPRGVKTSHGQEAIELRSGQRLRFVARSKSSGRGFSPDRVILDEALELPESAVAALLPAMSARPNPQVWYVSSAPDKAKHEHCEVLARVRRRGLAGNAEGLAYFEWSPDAEGLDDAARAALRADPAAWAAANPGLGIRITDEFVGRELVSLGSKTFDVERLSIGDWPVEDAERWLVIPKPAWLGRAGAEGRPEGPVAFGVAAAWPDAESAAIGVAGRRNGELLLQVVEHRPGTAWVADRMVELRDAHQPCAVVVDPGGPAGRLVAPLQAAGVELVLTTVRETAAAAGQLHSAVAGREPYARHYEQKELTDAVAAAQKRPLGDAWTWARRGAVDISPLEAVTLAAWGHATRAHLETAEPSVFYLDDLDDDEDEPDDDEEAE